MHRSKAVGRQNGVRRGCIRQQLVGEGDTYSNNITASCLA